MINEFDNLKWVDNDEEMSLENDSTTSNFENEDIKTIFGSLEEENVAIVEDYNQPLDLKYRPKDFNTVCGNIQEVKYLESLVVNESLPRFIILSGPPGCGKTTLAFILAQAKLCEGNVIYKPCGKCNKCQQIQNTLYNEGSNVEIPNIFFFDMGLNSSEEYLRKISDRIKGDYLYGEKILLIEELQRVPLSAQDSLLSTLEFIGNDTTVIVTTSDRKRIAEALRTRALEIKLNYPNRQQALDFLREISSKENITVTKDTLLSVLKYHSNNLRMSLKTLGTIKETGEVGITYIDEKTKLDKGQYINYFECAQESIRSLILFVETLDDKINFINNMKIFIYDIVKLRYMPSTDYTEEEFKKIQEMFSMDDNFLMKLLTSVIDLDIDSEIVAGAKLTSLAYEFNNNLYASDKILNEKKKRIEVDTSGESLINDMLKKINSSIDPMRGVGSVKDL